MDPFAPRPPTHDVIDFEQLWSLGQALAALGPQVTAAQVDQLASDRDVPRSHAWMALSYAPNVQVERAHGIPIAVCAARCQLWGAEQLMSELLALRDEREAAGRLAFDLVPRGCLNRCAQAPVAIAVLEDGMVGLDRATPAQVRELLDTVEAAEAEGEG